MYGNYHDILVNKEKTMERKWQIWICWNGKATGVTEEFLNMSTYGVAAWLGCVPVPHSWKNIVYSLIQGEK